MRGDLHAWDRIQDVFVRHHAHPYARIAAACAADRRAAGEGAPLVVLAALRRAAFAGRATDPWLGDVDAFWADLDSCRADIDAAGERGLVQFTEPLRMTDLLPGLLLATRRYPGRPLRLIEVGACAGLLLAPDRFAVHYPRATWAPPGARRALTCDLDVPPDLLDEGVDIADRIGVDLSPVDAADPGAYDHLRSFTWPGDAGREPRLRDCLAAVASDPPPVVAGDVGVVLPGLLAATVTREAVTVVLQSGLCGHLPGRVAMAMGRSLDRHADRGPLVLLTRSAVPADPQGLTARLRMVDLGARVSVTYAAADLLSERTRWLLAS